MEFRKVFDTIPDAFDKYRPRYISEPFADLIAYAGIDPGKTVLELGPGTGQATDPILDTGCSYHAIELDEHLADRMRQKYRNKANFHLVCDDFITHDFGGQKFDMIYSAAAIQWIPEEVAFLKTFALLKPGGTLGMLLLQSDYKTPNEPLYEEIQQVYSAYWRPEEKYVSEKFHYINAIGYGYVNFEKREYFSTRTFNADGYVALCGAYGDHIRIPEPYKTKFFDGLRQAVLRAGNKIKFLDTYILYLAKKPE